MPQTMSFDLTNIPEETLSEQAQKLVVYFQDIMGDYAEYVTVDVDIASDTNREIVSAHVRFSEDEIALHRIYAKERELSDRRGGNFEFRTFSGRSSDDEDKKINRFKKDSAETPIERFRKLFRPRLEEDGEEQDPVYSWETRTRIVERFGIASRDGYRFDISEMQPYYFNHATTQDEEVEIPGTIPPDKSEEFISTTRAAIGDATVQSGLFETLKTVCKSNGLDKDEFTRLINGHLNDDSAKGRLQQAFDDFVAPPEFMTHDQIYGALADFAEDVRQTVGPYAFEFEAADDSGRIDVLKTDIAGGGGLLEGKNSKAYRIMSLLKSLGLDTYAPTWSSATDRQGNSTGVVNVLSWEETKDPHTKVKEVVLGLLDKLHERGVREDIVNYIKGTTAFMQDVDIFVTRRSAPTGLGKYKAPPFDQEIDITPGSNQSSLSEPCRGLKQD